MQVSMQWLKDYIEIEQTPEELADLLTMSGVPVENINDMGAGLEKVVTGKITALEKHPNADKLLICTIDVGAAESLTIVTGAANVREGQVVPVAMIGAMLPNGVKISKGKLRGVVSSGMLCSASELRLDMEKLTAEQTDGIYILPTDTPVGVPAKDVLGLNDVILEFELTANRADCFSVLGLVREIAALTGRQAKKPIIHLTEDAGEKASELISIKIEAPDLCSRFSARVLKNVKVGSSPQWMQERLAGAGVRSINNIVDVTNFVMIELGQPMHAYDYDTLAGQMLVARRAYPGEKLTTLDDVQRTTEKDTLVIADSTQAAGLAGVMGGLATEVTETTKTVVLEAASFNNVSVRRTARRCGLHSEASGRFERGVDITNTVRALDRAAQLLQEMGACQVCEDIVDVYPGFNVAQQVKFSPQQINRRLGTAISRETMLSILRRLEFECNDTQEEIVVTVPSWRNDVQYMEDISEEIARVYGFDNIEATTPQGAMMQGGQSAAQSFVDDIKIFLCSLGLNETVSFSFTHPQVFDRMHVPAEDSLRKAVPILNPITDEFPILRTTIVGSVLETVARNLSRKNDDVKIFEIGTVFSPKALPMAELPNERLMLGGAITGRRNSLSWNQDKAMLDFYDAKGVVEGLLAKFGIGKYTVEVGEHYALHPGKTAVFKKGKDVIAFVGEVHPEVLADMDIAKKTFVFEMDIETLMKYANLFCRYQPLPKYPAISRDLAIVVAQDTASGDIEKVIVKNAGSLLKDIRLFDVYTGEQVTAGQKSLAFSLQFQSADKTLTDEEVDKPYQEVVAALEKSFDAKLRM